jgi:hypothetical protein
LLLQVDKSKVNVPELCYRRVRAMVFLDGKFEVAANKLLLLQSSELAQALHKTVSAQNKQAFCKWVEQMHHEHDQEVFFEGKIGTDSKKSCDLYSAVRVGRSLYKKVHGIRCRS